MTVENYLLQGQTKPLLKISSGNDNNEIDFTVNCPKHSNKKGNILHNPLSPSVEYSLYLIKILILK